jgi:hypothetical protein
MEVNDGIRFDGVFAAPHLEQAYRNSEIHQDQRRARLVILLALVLVPFFAAMDVFFLGLTFHSYVILFIRTVIIAVCAFLLYWLRQPRTPRELDRVFLIWEIMASVAVVYQACSRPASYTSHAVLNVLYVIFMYAIVPLPLRLQCICPLFVTAGVLFLGNWVNPWPDTPTLVVTSAALLIANIVGFEMSREVHRSRRRQFLALRHETEARLNLQLAMAQIKTLHGILPICSHCQRIWNDAGFWQQMELYVRDHTNVEFSHGLCPTCARQHYPEIDWEKKGL